MSDEVQRSLGRIEGTLAEIQRGMTEQARRLESHTADDTKRLDEHDDRLGRVERKQSYDKGERGVISAIVAAVVAAGVGYFTKS